MTGGYQWPFLDPEMSHHRAAYSNVSCARGQNVRREQTDRIVNSAYLSQSQRARRDHTMIETIYSTIGLLEISKILFD